MPSYLGRRRERRDSRSGCVSRVPQRGHRGDSRRHSRGGLRRVGSRIPSVSPSETAGRHDAVTCNQRRRVCRDSRSPYKRPRRDDSRSPCAHVRGGDSRSLPSRRVGEQRYRRSSRTNPRLLNQRHRRCRMRRARRRSPERRSDSAQQERSKRSEFRRYHRLRCQGRCDVSQPRLRRKRRRHHPSQAEGHRSGDEHFEPDEQRRRRKRREIGAPEHFQWERGMALGPDGRYTVERLLGDGVFGRVLACTDRSSDERVAVKVAGCGKRPQRQAEREADALRQLERYDRERCWRYCPRLLETFVHADQGMCLVYQPLDSSLQDLLKNSGGEGLFLQDVQAIARQLLSGLAFIHAGGLAHTDIKCSNVMLRDGSFDAVAHPRLPAPAQAPRMRQQCKAVFIDFGGATVPPVLHGKVTKNEEMTRPGVRVGARHIRAPEIILGLDWDVIADEWSMGCLLYSLYTGDRLFSVHDDMEHLAWIEKLLEVHVPASMCLSTCPRVLAKGLAFDRFGRLDWPRRARSEESIEKVEEVQPLATQILSRHGTFLELLRGLLAVDPNIRLGSEAALRKAFCTADRVQE